MPFRRRRGCRRTRSPRQSEPPLGPGSGPQPNDLPIKGGNDESRLRIARGWQVAQGAGCCEGVRHVRKRWAAAGARNRRRRLVQGRAPVRSSARRHGARGAHVGSGARWRGRERGSFQHLGARHGLDAPAAQGPPCCGASGLGWRLVHSRAVGLHIVRGRCCRRVQFGRRLLGQRRRHPRRGVLQGRCPGAGARRADDALERHRHRERERRPPRSS